MVIHDVSEGMGHLFGRSILSLDLCLCLEVLLDEILHCFVLSFVQISIEYPDFEDILSLLA